MIIDQIEVIITDLPGRLQRTVSSGRYDTGASGTMVGKPVLVKVHAEGIVGYGQVRPISPGHLLADTVHSVFGAIADYYGPALIGTSIFGMGNVADIFDRILPGNPAARFAIDSALHDALGKVLGRPVHDLIGGACQDSIPLEWSVSMADDQKTVIDEAERAVSEHGCRVICLKAGGPRGLDEDVRNFRAVRAAVGQDVQIGVDPNTAWTVDETLRFARQVDHDRLDYIEQPIERHDIAGLAQLRRGLGGVPLMADESLFTLHDAYRLATAAAVDVFCLKLYKHGGLTAARKIAAVAEAANVRVNIGGLAAFSQLEAAAAAHLYASLPERRVMPAGEFLFGLGVVGPDPLVPETDFVCKDGRVSVPKGPGLGITIDENAVRRHTLKRQVVQS